MDPERTMTLNTPPTITDSKKGYPVMSLKSGFALVDNDRRLIREHAHQVREALFACTTQAQVECSVAFARYLNYAGLNSDNYWLFMRIIMTNNPWVIDELLHDRQPRLLFSTIRPDNDLVDAAFEALFARHPDEIYAPAMEAMLGIIQNVYFDPDDGYRIRKFTIMDINTLGKFLLKAETQDNAINCLILDILDKMATVGQYYGEPDKNVLSKHAFNVRYAYFDRTRNLVDAIPEPLLVRFPDRTGVHPEDDYAELIANRKQRRRDSYGRFIKERNDEEVVARQLRQNPSAVENKADEQKPASKKTAEKKSAKVKPAADAAETPSTKSVKTPAKKKPVPKKTK